MVLSKKDIRSRCELFNLITPWQEKCIQTCSYDMTFSGEYYYYNPKDGNRVNVRMLQPYEKLMIPAEAICYVLTEESVTMPNDLTASISLAFGLIKKGVMLANQPPYDPGYSGKTVALIHNLSDEPIEIEKGQHILNMVFEKLSSPVDDADLYKGKYQNLNTLKSYCTQVKKGGIFVLQQNFNKEKKKMMKQIPVLLTGMTIILAILTIVIALREANNLISNSKKENVLNGNETILDLGDVDTFTIEANGTRYLIELNEQKVIKDIK